MYVCMYVCVCVCVCAETHAKRILILKNNTLVRFVCFIRMCIYNLERYIIYSYC